MLFLSIFLASKITECRYQVHLVMMIYWNHMIELVYHACNGWEREWWIVYYVYIQIEIEEIERE